ncbi:MAG: bifunctional riboflavin kinase/FAD synthetase [Anaerolineales bacterium]|nr:bifunctional riboflavin kinase/FAD synthetase [Anaerolineales bacterium]
MRIIRDFAAAHLNGPTVLTIGTFDGLHRGHQALIKQLQQSAKERQAQAAVIAFHPRPKTVLAPHLPHNDYLTTPGERIALFEELGLDILILIPFTLEFSQTTAADFMKLLVDRLNLIELWAGHDFALGKNREGNLEKLRALGHELNYHVCEFTPILINDKVVSSTQIRDLLRAGEVRQATEFLGRYPSLNSEIVQGANRGHTIGFPTANFAVPPERLLPANGVYATFVKLPGETQRRASVTNVGIRPSFEGTERTVEAYIFDFDQMIYGQRLTLEFVERLRPEKKFNGINELVAQIRHDAEQARELLAEEKAVDSRRR